MTVYKGANYLPEQLESILKQLRKDDELIIVDDASPDHSANLIEGYKDPRIRLITNEVNLGVVRSFEKALYQVTGDLICLSDQDDRWADHKVDTLLKLFSNEKPVLVVSDCEIINAHGEKQIDSFFQLRGGKPGLLHNLIKNGYLGCAMCFDARILPRVLPFPKHVNMHDEWIGLSAELFGKVIFTKEKLIYYRRHDANVTNLHRNSLAWGIKKRMSHVWALIYKHVIKGKTEF